MMRIGLCWAVTAIAMTSHCAHANDDQFVGLILNTECSLSDIRRHALVVNAQLCRDSTTEVDEIVSTLRAICSRPDVVESSDNLSDAIWAFDELIGTLAQTDRLSAASALEIFSSTLEPFEGNHPNSFGMFNTAKDQLTIIFSWPNPRFPSEKSDRVSKARLLVYSAGRAHSLGMTDLALQLNGEARQTADEELAFRRREERLTPEDRRWHMTLQHLSIAGVYRTIGELEPALEITEMLQQALDVDDAARIGAVTQLAVAFARRGDLQQAASLMETINPISERLSHDQVRDATVHGLIDRGDLDQAEREARLIQEPALRALALVRLGTLQVIGGRQNRGNALQKEARDIIDNAPLRKAQEQWQSDDWRWRFRVLLMLTIASIQLESGNPLGASDAFDSAVAAGSIDYNGEPRATFSMFHSAEFRRIASELAASRSQVESHSDLLKWISSLHPELRPYAASAALAGL